MKNIALTIAAVLVVGLSVQARAEDHPGHFKGKPAETLGQAVSNFSVYNAMLAVLVEKKSLTPAEMHQVHEITYTLGNALNKIRAELDDLSETLEKVHIASESGKEASIKADGRAYLYTARTVIK